MAHPHPAILALALALAACADALVTNTTFEIDPSGPDTQIHPAAPYQPALTCVSDGVCLLAWAEGLSPAFRVKARFVDLR